MIEFLRSERAHVWGMTLLRIVVGSIFILHGWQKLTGFTIPGFTGFLSSLGIPAPGLFAVLVTFVELLGGLALIVGAFTRYAALLLAVDMLVAIWAVHLPAGFFLTMEGTDGYEFVLLLMVVSLAFLLMGAGPISVDSRLSERLPV